VDIQQGISSRMGRAWPEASAAFGIGIETGRERRSRTFIGESVPGTGKRKKYKRNQDTRNRKQTAIDSHHRASPGAEETGSYDRPAKRP
jgi:hypothetical protein